MLRCILVPISFYSSGCSNLLVARLLLALVQVIDSDMVLSVFAKVNKVTLWRPPDANFQPGASNALKLLSGGLLAQICSLGSEML